MKTTIQIKLAGIVLLSGYALCIQAQGAMDSKTEKRTVTALSVQEPPPAVVFVYPGTDPALLKKQTVSGMQYQLMAVSYQRNEEEDIYNPIYDVVKTSTCTLSPTGDNLVFSFEEGDPVQAVYLYHLQGGLIASQKSNTSETAAIPIGEFPDGTYHYIIKGLKGITGRGVILLSR